MGEGGGGGGVLEAVGDGAVPGVVAVAVGGAREVMSEAKLTKLAVAAMKAKLKGDKVAHARLTEEVRTLCVRVLVR